MTTRESLTGRVLGMQHTSTNPPAAAARSPARQVFFALEAWLAKVGVDVDESREQPSARALDEADAVARTDIKRSVPAGARDAAALDDHVHHSVERSRGIDGAHTAKDKGFDHDAARDRV